MLGFFWPYAPGLWKSAAVTLAPLSSAAVAPWFVNPFPGGESSDDAIRTRDRTGVPSRLLLLLAGGPPAHRYTGLAMACRFWRSCCSI